MDGTPATRLARATEDYAEQHVPLRDYAGLAAVFNVALAAALVAGERGGRRLPQRIGAGDLVLLGVATHKVSRLITKERVTAFLRAPFTRYQRAAGHGEVEEEARGTGLRRTLGELLVCPFCTGQWVAGGFTAGMLLAPRPTRVVAGMFAGTAISDFLQLAYKAAENRA